ncbi:MAG: EamA family transporter, partial [Actinobacteria bacterium]|nr:EamA family transporter [Actinomycetota bacterium]
LDMAANLAYLEAVRGGMLSVVAVVSSLYPASTVALAFALDRERVDRWQGVGMGLAAAALVLVTLGRA